MLGNDAFGRKVSLLNDADCSSKALSAAPTCAPTLAGRSSGGPSVKSAGPAPNSKTALSLSHRHRQTAPHHHSTPALATRSSPPPSSLPRGRGDVYSYSRKSSYSSHRSANSDAVSTATTPSSSQSRSGSAQNSPRLPPLPHPPHSAAVPPLARHDSTLSTQSSDSSGSRQSLPTPSPMTPTYAFDPLDPTKAQLLNPTDPYHRATAGPYFTNVGAIASQPQQPLPHGLNQPYFAANGSAPAVASLVDDGFATLSSQYPNLNAPFAFPTGADLIQPAAPSAAPSLATASVAQPVSAAVSAVPTSAPAPTSPTSPTSATSGNNGAAKPPRKKYPCPHAARFNCTDTFTTSGHAARHGKKHTGEKNILCPTCHKAFTRKDNMKQHERTHRPHHRDSAASTNSGSASSDATKRTKATSSASSTATVAAAARAASHAKSASSTSLSPPSPTTRRGSPPVPTAADFAPSVRLAPAALDAPLPSLTAPTAALSLGAGAPTDVMDFDIDPAIGRMDILTTGGAPMKMERPTVGLRTGSDGSEGGSPGLDALALAASGLG